MDCTSCGRTNRPAARFCDGCGKSLPPACPSCGSECRPDAQFCDACGTSLVARPADDAVARKVVTIVFADLVGSTSLHERIDAESARRLMDRYYRALHVAVEAHGGTVVKLLGDGVMAAFGVPRVAEDDAIRAVRAAVGMQQAFRELAQDQAGALGEVGLRVAVNTGEVVVSDDHRDVVGDPVNVAARLQEEAHVGDVLIGESTHRLVADLVTLAPFGALTLKGRSETVAAYRVVSLDRPAGAPATAFVGRDGELRRIMTVYDSAVAAPGARLAAVLGSPGLGKSRLIAELARRLEKRATVLTARCDAAGGATFAPFAGALRTYLGIDDGTSGEDLRAAINAVLVGNEAERARITDGIAALLAGAPASPEETFFVVRRLLAALATKQPLVLAIDDLQWAEPLLLDLTEHLVQWSSDVALLVVVAARPELRDTRSSLAAQGGLVSEVVTLAGLDAGAATRLAASVIGADELPAAIAGRVLAVSEGNPLFVGELVRMLVHDGALKREGGRWIAGVELAAIEMPPTIHALLAARIERLRPEERAILERAAVVGRHFSRTAIAQLLPRELGADLDTRLESLRRSELIEPDPGWFLGEPLLRFHHVLIRDAAYRRLLKNTRAELHGRFADWLESRVGEAVEHDETIGWHLEQAHRHLGELGPIDEHGRTIGERAARYLAAAGRRALARDDVPLAASLLGRALDRLDPADPARADLTLDWCEALLAAGEVGAAARAIDELARFTSGSERLRAWHTCFAGQLAVLTEPEALHATADAVAAAADVLASTGDAAGEAKAHWVHALVFGRLGKVGACEAALDRALAAARRAGDRRRANAVLAGAPLAALWGPSPVTRASGRCLDVVRVLRITQGAPAVEAIALSCQAVLEALRGRTDAARRMIASSRHMVEELGITHRLLEADVFAGIIELLESDAAAAERALRGAYDGLRSHGLAIDAAQAAALLGRALLAQGRAAEAEALSHESEALAGDDLKAAIAWRGVRAEALASRGEHASAIDFARGAVEIAAATDALLDHADARLALAAALRAAVRHDEADAEEARAIELWEAKGATLLAERARSDVPRVAQVERTPDARAAPARPVCRRVRPNAATAMFARLNTVFAARDRDALVGLLADSVDFIDHTTRAVFDRQGLLTTWQSILRADDLTYRNEPLATLGESLGLCRLSLSASGVAGGRFDVGAYEADNIILVGVDPQQRITRLEFFTTDRLGDAVARLYERYAELLPDGPARECATATARSVAVLTGPLEVDRWATVFAPAVEWTDYRTVGLGSVHGAEALLRAVRALLELVENWGTRVDDILDLRPDALVVRWTNFGTDRASGGAFERYLCQLWVFGADGFVTRWEQSEADQDQATLARLDEITAEPVAARFARAASADERALLARSSRRRVRPNAATANAARLDAAIAARDADAVAAVYADESDVVEHSAGAGYDRQGSLDTWRAFLRAENPTLAHEPLATLGDSLALCRLSTSASGFAGRQLNVGAYEREEIILFEVDTQGRRRQLEIFATDRLGDAVARLYERYAELLPDGPARERAAATARSIAAMSGPYDPDRSAPVFAPAIEAIDHRTLATWSARGVEALLQHFRSLLDVADDITFRYDEVLCLHSSAFVGRGTHSGTARAGGGTYERQYIHLLVFGTDGLMVRFEWFDADREDEALARFDELTAEAPTVRFVSAALADQPATQARPVRRRVRPNAATANLARIEAAVAARDIDAFPTLHADSFESVHHPTGLTWGRDATLALWRSLHEIRDLDYRIEPLATLGDSIALCRIRLSARGEVGAKFDVAAWESEEIVIADVDAEGRLQRCEFFAVDRRGDAVARLYEHYGELLPDGPARDRATATARSVAALQKPPDVVRYRAAVAPDIEHVDRRTVGVGSVRGVEAHMRAIDALLELSYDFATRIDDIFVLRSDALLVRWTSVGTDRASGGAFERPFLWLAVFGTDGLATRLEQFDIDRDDEALARFDELTAGPTAARIAGTASRDGGATPVRPVRRRVRANAATAHAARADAMIAARDADALPALFADEVEVVDHTTGAKWDREGVIASWRSLLSSQDPMCHSEPLATLGDSLALSRFSASASGFADGKLDVGAYQREEIILNEVDANGRRRRSEVFAPDRLGEAIARIYERYAEILPPGPTRERATATARSVAVLAWTGPIDLDRLATVNARDLEAVDHRTVGFGSLHGAEAVLRSTRALVELSEEITGRVDDILGLRHDALLMRWTTFGTERAGGGAFERQVLLVFVFGSDGLATRWEQFDVDRDDEALARFDELTGEPTAVRIAGAAPRDGRAIPVRPSPRRVRANAATAYAARLDATFAARDADAFTDLLADQYEVVDHTTGVTYDRQGELASHRGLLSCEDPTHVHEPLATLGDSLAICRLWTSASRFVSRKLDIGAHERERINLIEVDAQGRGRRLEVFAADRVGDAIARLYGRYAELLPDGPARARAATIARSVAAMVGAFEPDRYATAYAPAIECVDRRTLGTYFARRAEELRQHFRSWLDLADDIVLRDDEILSLQPDALVVRRMFTGTARAGGGTFERPFINLWVFGSDGLLTRLEYFNIDRDVEALARFDELMAEAAVVRVAGAASHDGRATPVRAVHRRVRANAATAHSARLDAAVDAREADALPTLYSDESESVDHTTGTTWDRQGLVATWRSLLRAQDPTCLHEPLATLGDSLALCRVSTSASGFVGGKFDVGAYERDEIILTEVDARGRHRRSEVFAADRLDDAIIRFYERYADLLPAGPARERAAANARSHAALVGRPFDIDRLATALAPTIEVADHRRTVGIGSLRGADALVSALRSLLELTDEFVNRTDDILGLRPDALVIRVTNFGTQRAGGGAYERPFLMLWVFGADGLATRFEQFDSDREDEALARFDELTAEPATARYANAATRAVEKFERCWRERDWDGVVATFTATHLMDDRRALFRMQVVGEDFFANERMLFGVTASRWSSELIATRGERLALLHARFTAEVEGGGPMVVEMLDLVEVDTEGRRIALVVFDSDDLEAAYAELDDRYFGGEAAAYADAAAVMRAFVRAIIDRDWDAMPALFSPDFVVSDHRPLGWETLRGPAVYVETLKSLVDLAPDVRLRNDHMQLSEHAVLFVDAWVGTREGGAFEAPRAVVFELDERGRMRGMELYNPEQIDEAWARFAAISASTAADPVAAVAIPTSTTRAPLRIPPNAATRVRDRVADAFAARDWSALRPLASEGFVFEDRTKRALLSGGVELWISNYEVVSATPGAKISRELIATFGDRVALERFVWSGGVDGSAFETHFIVLTEVGADGRLAASISFDLDDRRAAFIEAQARFIAGEAAAIGGQAPIAAFERAFGQHDWEALRECMAQDLVFHDRRTLGLLGALSGEQWIESMRVQADMAPDTDVESLRILAWNGHGRVAQSRVFGTLRDGGPFENILIRVIVTDGDRVRRFEVFDVGDADQALARFAELRPAHTSELPRTTC